YFLRLGKRVEEADFHFRFDKDKETAMIIVDEINTIIAILSDDDKSKVKVSEEQSINPADVMDSIHKKIEGIIVY
ncbi:MAG: hypothetical protein QG617_513, partial [Campylobacterota bacterium]|nr:hypothetical protein [Campylobacterota bacterium]